MTPKVVRVPPLSHARRCALWRERNPEAWKACRARYYAKNRAALILVNSLRQAGVTPPTLAEARRMLAAP